MIVFSSKAMNECAKGSAQNMSYLSEWGGCTGQVLGVMTDPSHHFRCHSAESKLSHSQSKMRRSSSSSSIGDRRSSNLNYLQTAQTRKSTLAPSNVEVTHMERKSRADQSRRNSISANLIAMSSRSTGSLGADHLIWTSNPPGTKSTYAPDANDSRRPVLKTHVLSSLSKEEKSDISDFLRECDTSAARASRDESVKLARPSCSRPSLYHDSSHAVPYTHNDHSAQFARSQPSLTAISGAVKEVVLSSINTPSLTSYLREDDAVAELIHETPEPTSFNPHTDRSFSPDRKSVTASQLSPSRALNSRPRPAAPSTHPVSFACHNAQGSCGGAAQRESAIPRGFSPSDRCIAVPSGSRVTSPHSSPVKPSPFHFTADDISKIVPQSSSLPRNRSPPTVRLTPDAHAAQSSQLSRSPSPLPTTRPAASQACSSHRSPGQSPIPHHRSQHEAVMSHSMEGSSLTTTLHSRSHPKGSQWVPNLHVVDTSDRVNHAPAYDDVCNSIASQHFNTCTHETHQSPRSSPLPRHKPLHLSSEINGFMMNAPTRSIATHQYSGDVSTVPAHEGFQITPATPSLIVPDLTASHETSSCSGKQLASHSHFGGSRSASDETHARSSSRRSTSHKRRMPGTSSTKPTLKNDSTSVSDSFYNSERSQIVQIHPTAGTPAIITRPSTPPPSAQSPALTFKPQTVMRSTSPLPINRPPKLCNRNIDFFVNNHGDNRQNSPRLMPYNRPPKQAAAVINLAHPARRSAAPVDIVNQKIDSATRATGGPRRDTSSEDSPGGDIQDLQNASVSALIPMLGCKPSVASVMAASGKMGMSRSINKISIADPTSHDGLSSQSDSTTFSPLTPSYLATAAKYKNYPSHRLLSPLPSPSPSASVHNMEYGVEIARNDHPPKPYHSSAHELFHGGSVHLLKQRSPRGSTMLF